MVGHGCLFAWNFSVTRSIVLTETVSRTRPNMMLLSQPTVWKTHWPKTVQCTITEVKLQYNGNLSSVLRTHILTGTEISKNIVTLLRECNLIDSMSNVASFQHLWSILASISTIKETFYMSMQPVYNIAPCTKYKQIFKNWNKSRFQVSMQNISHSNLTVEKQIDSKIILYLLWYSTDIFQSCKRCDPFHQTLPPLKSTPPFNSAPL